MPEAGFNGFSEQTLSFLKNLSINNNKKWFEENRADYQEYVLKPLRDLVIELGPFMASIDYRLELTPAVNKTISRINRDTRFSRDKSPYKSNMWLTFKRPNKDWKDAPVYYF